MQGFLDVNAYIENVGIQKTNIGFENGIITYIGDENKLDEIIPLPDNALVVPGFVDEHIHGAAGSDTMDGTASALQNIANAVASEGTTSFLATTMTQSHENILKALRAVKEYKAQSEETGAELLGVHLEGPFISKKHIGAQPIEYVVKPSVDIFKEYEKESGNNIKIVSLAPEEDGAGELIAYLKERNIVASAGHTDAAYLDIVSAMKCGLSSITHTFNAQKPLHHREVGTVGSALLFDELNCEAICDTIHLSIPAIKLLIKNKPHDKFTLITDAMRAKHLPDGESELGGQKVIVKNGEARLENGVLAGSILKMNDAIKNLVTKCGVSITDAIDFATANPAKNLNIYGKKGSISLGKDADLTVIDNNFNVLLTLRNGKIIFKTIN